MTPSSYPSEPKPSQGERSDRRARWHAYYSEKRIVHQWLQVDLLKSLPVAKILEIGPYLGAVTALLSNAGYQVTTLDIEGDRPRHGAVGHIRADVRRLDIAALQGFDALLCCETLEHLPFAEVPGVLANFHATNAPYLILSMPYEGPQLGLSLYLNSHRWPRFKYFHRFHFRHRFRAPNTDLWESHRWEIGYRDYPLRKLRRVVEAAGYKIVRTEFTSGTRSVFLVCRRVDHARA